jgi:hypothetical protein
MAVSYQLIRAPFRESLTGEIHSLADKVFGTRIDDGGAWRFENMPDFTVIEARVGEQLVGFKVVGIRFKDGDPEITYEKQLAG